VGYLTSKPDDKTFASEAKERAEGILGRLFGRSHHEPKSTLDLPDIQGFILRGYRMPMVRHFLLSVATPTEARKLLGRFVSGDETDTPQITTAEDWHVGFAPGPGDNPADAPRHKPDYCLNVAITRRSRSNHSAHSLTVPPNARDWWATRERVIRKTGLAPLGRATITSW